MKKAIRFTKALLLSLLITTYSCNNDDDNTPIINLEDLEVTIDENPTNGQVIGTVQSDSNNSLTFSITSQTPVGALSIGANTGELTVADASLFDFETNPTITAVVAANEAQNTATITINLNNVEATVQNLTVAIDENPANGDVVGTIQANGGSNFSITSQSPAGALNIDANSGQLTVADATLFNFETNPTITAMVSSDEATNAATVTVNLVNVNEITVQDLTVTIDENPTDGQVIGSVQTSGGTATNFTITSQNPAGALNIDANSGELTVIDPNLFDFETNPVITATVTVDDSENPATVTINLNDVDEVSAQNTNLTINENPSNGDVVGTLQASGSNLTYSITFQNPAGAFNINANTGELSVADASLFDFETNPNMLATISVSNSTQSVSANAFVALNDVNEIGEFKFGGVIFWIDPTSNNSSGLVCAVTDLGFNQWGCSTISTGASGIDIGTGASNTQQIITACTTSGIAADLSTNLNLNGYNDWFLPSKDELNEMYINRQIINTASIANGGANLLSIYWSSSEVSMTNAWVQSFTSGDQADNFGKNMTFGVRAVRAWTN